MGVGAGAFELVGLKPDLGALVAGLMLANHPRAGELADRLLSFKDVLLDSLNEVTRFFGFLPLVNLLLHQFH